jgi:hypothetical protein
MKGIFYILFVFLCLCCKSGTETCNYPIDFQLYRVFPKDKFEIRVNDNDSCIYRKTFKDLFIIDAYKPRKYLLKSHCYNGDSLKVHFLVNDIVDTIFYVSPKLVKCIYLGCDQSDSINVYFDYRNGQSDMVFE